MIPTTDDRVLLRDLVDSYALAVDALDVERFATLWAPGAVLAVHDVTGAVRTWEGDRIPTMLTGVRRYLRTLHFVGSHRSWADGGDVRGTTSCFAHHLVAADAADGAATAAHDRVVAIRYDDRYVPGAGDARWRFATRDVHILWRTRHEVDELGPLPEDHTDG